MTTYNNLEIAQVSLTFSGELNPSISTRTFDLSTLSFLPNVPLIDQIEVERIFDTGYDTKFSENVFTIADRRQMFILPKAWYSINEQTKILTIVDLSTIPTYATNNLYYPESRTFVLETLDSNQNIQTLDIPNFLVNNIGTNINNVLRGPDIVIIRRKTLSIDSIVTFAPGTRLTTTQLNLQFNQLKYIIQELIAKIRNESILKFDENAVDGPFLGGSDLKMSNNYIKDLNSKSIGEINVEFSTGIGSSVVSGATFATNVGAVYDAITQGTVRRTTMNGGTATPFSGHFTATPFNGSPLRITGMADAVADSDAAAFGQIKNASNLTTGTLNTALISNNAIPLNKLATTNTNNYTLPSSALETVNATTGTFGTNSPNNTGNLLQLTTDNKGRITNITQRNLGNDDLPDVGTVSASTYGDSNTPLVQVTVNSKGIITGISERAINSTDLVSINASNISSGTIGDTYLPTSGVTAGTYGNTSTTIPTQLIVDSKGRITSASSGSITTGVVSDFTNQTTSLIQSNAPYWDSNNSVFTALRSATRTKLRGVATPTDNSDAVPLDYLTTNALVISNNQVSVQNNPIKNLAMAAAPATTDAANVGYVLALSLYGATPTIPATITKSFSSGTSDSGLYRYEFTYTNGASDNLDSPTAEMLLVLDSDNKTYTPVTTPTAFGFSLDIGSTTKTVKVWLSASSMTGKSLYVRNFGISRLVSSGPATASSLGLVQVPVAGGITINNGQIGLATATASQIGGIKLGTGLVDIGSSVVKVDLSDSVSTNDSTKVASSKAVKDLSDLVVAKAGSTMTGKLVLRTPSSSSASLTLPSGPAPSSPAAGDLWFSNTDAYLQFYTGSGASKSIAFTDSNITGSAASWTTNRTLTLSNHVTGSVTFNGSGNMSLSATLNPATVVRSISGTANQITATKDNSTGIVTLTLPQDINTTSNVAFNQATVNGVIVGSNSNTISTVGTNNALVLAPNGSGSVSISSNAVISGGLGVTGNSSFTGSVVIGSAAGLTLSNSSARITLASSGTTIDNAASQVSGISNVGDIYLRTPTNGKVFIIPNNTLSTAPTATDEVITKSALNTALSPYALASSLGTYMAITGTLATGTNSQVLGTATGNNTGTFAVKINNTDRFTISNSGVAALTNGLGVTGGITASGAISGNSIVATNKITSAATAWNDSNTTVTTKDYVDSFAPKVLILMQCTGAGAVALTKHKYNNFNGDAPTVSKAGTGIYKVVFPAGVFADTQYSPFVSLYDSNGVDTYYVARVISATELLVYTGYVGGTSQNLKNINGPLRLVIYS